MKKALLLILFSFPLFAYAQFTGPLDSNFRSINQNSVSVMETRGDTLWIGPRLNYNIQNGPDWFVPQEADSVLNGRGRVFSMAIRQDTIIAGLGFNDTNASDNPQTQMGIYFSTDGGNTFSLSGTDRTLDVLSDENVVSYTDLDGRERTFISLQYGGQEILASPITVPQQSPPFEVDFKGDVVFFAAWASGIRRSMDFGETWERIILPPVGINNLDPENDYDFIFDPVTPGSGTFMGENYPNGWQNFLGFSVLIDEANNQVWAGTAGGINISDNALTAPVDSIRWRRIASSNRQDGLLGNWVITIRQNPFNDEIWLTNQIVNSGERNGLVSTTNNGQSFRQHLVDEVINDIQFDGEYIYATGDNGLFISPDNGDSWRQIRQIRSPNTFLRSNARYFSLAKTTDRMWVGTSDGLASTTDNGETWSITRTNMPLEGGNQFQPDAPNVETYAYPNPFSPRIHEVVRIRFELDTQNNITVQIFDFGMNLIKTFNTVDQREPGVYEVVWNGFDELGRQVANGPAFYRVRAGSKSVDGKILILE